MGIGPMLGFRGLTASLALLLLLSTALAACGEGGDQQATPPAGEQQSQ